MNHLQSRSATDFRSGLLGELYYKGLGVPQDYAAARNRYEKASGLGSAKAMNNLGNLYRDGRGVVQDYAQARSWYEKASGLGSAEAMNNLGIFYQNGDGVVRSFVDASALYEKAAKLGSTDAENNIGHLATSFGLRNYTANEARSKDRYTVFPGETPLRERCHMGECDWIDFKNIFRIGTNSNGYLVRYDSIHGSSAQPKSLNSRVGKIDWESSYTDQKYIFCSTKNPYIISEKDGKWVASALDPGNDSAIIGALQGVYSTYYRICHNFREFSDGSTKLARDLGYPIEISSSDNIVLKYPNDVLNLR